MSDCYHCGLPVPAGQHFPVFIRGNQELMCCPGCQAVASAIVDGGLEKFYDYRSADGLKPEEGSNKLLQYYDLPEVQEDFVIVNDDDSRSLELMVTGITCSACAWLIERHLQRIPGVISVAVNVTSYRCWVTWLPEKVKLSELLKAFEQVGYEARPAGDVEAEKQRIKESRTFLLRLGLAGLGMMQAGMVAIALYAGGFHGIDVEWRQLLRWVSLLIVTPVVLFSARPFFSTAWRSLKVGQLVMDVPVSLAITLAYLASVWATVTSSGEVYFDSVSMFTFFLLVGRYLEMRVRHRNESYGGKLSQLIPPVVTRIGPGMDEVVPVKVLQAGERVRVAPGEIIPCDGEIKNGDSYVVEALLTGEENPVPKHPGDVVSAGTVNTGHPLEVRVTAVGRSTRLSAIMDLVGEAERVKPRRAALADRYAGYFVAAVLVIASTVAVSWSFVDPSRALWVTLSVLVVTCPCALSLATPAALTVATGELRKRGLLIRKAHVLETLGSLDRVVFDKTGTLTLGHMQIAAVKPTSGFTRERVLSLCAALELGANHPIARAFKVEGIKAPQVNSQRTHVGKGVSGIVEGESYAFGKPELLEELFGYRCDTSRQGGGQWLFLGNSTGYIGAVQLTDQWRPGAAEAVSALKDAGLFVELLSGDRREVVAEKAAELGIARHKGGVSPEEKLAHVRELQAYGSRVLVVGDGINDVPVLSAADVSVALGDAVDITRLHADSLLISGNLKVLPEAVAVARKTTAVIGQNMAWAILYNLLALPLACLGYVPPWAAAIGMSASSLIVVVNGLRLSSGRVGLEMTK